MEKVNTLLKWKIHPAKTRPAATMVLTFFILFSGYTIDFFVKEHLLAGAVVIVFAMSLGKWYMPTEYIVTDKGIESKIFLKKDFTSWESIKRAGLSGRGFFIEKKNLSYLSTGLKGVFIVTDPAMILDKEPVNTDIQQALEKIFVNKGLT
jgi:hypothetical protein